LLEIRTYQTARHTRRCQFVNERLDTRSLRNEQPNPFHASSAGAKAADGTGGGALRNDIRGLRYADSYCAH